MPARHARGVSWFLPLCCVVVSILSPAGVAAAPETGVPSCQTGRPGCVWTQPRDAKVLFGHVESWRQRHLPQAARDFDIGINGGLMTVKITVGSTRDVIRLRLEGACEGTPVVEAPGLDLPEDAIADLVRDLPAERKAVCEGLPEDGGVALPVERPRGPVLGALWRKFTQAHRNRFSPPLPLPAPERVVFLVVAVLGVMGLAAFRGRREVGRPWGRAILPHLLISVMGVIAIAPVLLAPLEIGAEVERILIARLNPLGDWNHPSLIYLLNHPVTRLSLEPWAVRLVPAAAVLALGFLVFVAGRRFAGEVPGLLAAAWYLAGVRLRSGLNDMGDWDLAGCFLVALILMLDRLDRMTAKPSLLDVGAFLLVVLFASMSSWLALIPLGVLALVLAVRLRRRRDWGLLVAGVWGVLAIRGVQALEVFLLGRTFRDWGPQSWQELTREMLAQAQPGSSSIGLLLVGVGILVLLAGARRLAYAYTAGSLLVLPLGILAIWHFSAANGGYYINLVAGPIAVAGAVGLGAVRDLARRGASRLPGCAGDLPCPRAWAIALSALAVLATLDLPPHHYREGMAHIPEFARRIEGDSLPVVTNLRELGPVSHYLRAAETDRDPMPAWRARLSVMEARSFDGRRTWIHLDKDPKKAFRDLLPQVTEFYLVLAAVAPRGTLDARHPEIEVLRKCSPMFPLRRDVVFLKCGPLGSP